MGLSTAVVHPDFIKHHQGVITSTSTSRVRIERVLSRGEWTEENGIGADNLLTLYVGPAEIDTKDDSSRRAGAQDSVDSQTVKVQLPYHGNEIPWPADFEHFQSNDRVTILMCSDPMMEGIALYVHGWLGSTYSWARNLFCRTNTKQI